MKKFAIFGSIVGFFLTPVQVLADQTLTITPPKSGYNDLGVFVSNILTLAFAIAILLVLIMLILGAYEWIASGGDKEAVGKARNRIINALIGLAVLAVTFALTKVFGQFVGIDVTKLVIPTPP